MSYLKVMIAFLSFLTFEASSCDLTNAIRHTNPDGTQGGFVSHETKVASTVYIGPNAKVCDRAWIDGNARILDYAIVYEDAWVREYSVVKDRATVSGRAVIKGTRSSIVEVGETSKIYGSAKIMTGTKVFGRAEVFGEAVLEDSTVSGNAKVCLGTRISNENIENEYFCNPSFTASKVELKLSSLDEQKFNTSRNNIIIEADDHLFEDRRFFTVLINNESVSKEEIKIYKNKLSFNHLGLLKEGFNSISVTGKDRLGKDIESKDFFFVVGSSNKLIEIDIDGTERVEAIAEVDGVEYKINVSLDKSGIRFQGLPNTDMEYKITLKVASGKGYFVDTFPSEALPSEINLTSYPAFISNDTDFSTSLSSWFVNQPANVEVVDDGLKILFEDNNPLELSKTFSLSSNIASLSFEIQSPSQPSLFDGSLEVEMIFVSMTSKKIQLEKAKLSDLYAFANSPKGLRYSYSMPDEGTERVVFIMRLSNSLKNSKISQAVTLKNGKSKTFDVYFTPKSMTALNRRSASSGNIDQDALIFSREISYPLENADCSSSKYKVTNTSIFKTNIEEIKFLSVGPTPSMPLYRENRIYGNLSFRNLRRGDIEDIRLVVWQYNRNTNEPHQVTQSLSSCVLERFNDQTSTPLNSSVTFSPELDISKPLFSIPASDLRNFDTSLGQTAVMFIEADIKTANGVETIESIPKLLKILKSPWGDGSYTYGEVEDYDSVGADILRTGGDKWILPAYSDMLMSIVNNAPQIPVKWRFGDLARSNGGTFLDHGATHKDGQDADIKFEEVEIGGVGKISFNFRELKDDPLKWDVFLDELDKFFISFKDKFEFIREIYLERTSDSKKFLNVRFANRCYLDSRFIQFERNRGERSLLRDVPPMHWHHLHLRFNEVDLLTGQPTAYSLAEKPIDDLDDFWFELEPSGNNLRITPKKPEDFKDKYVAWRFQSVTGYEDYDMNLELGPRVTVQPIADPELNKTNTELKRHIIVTIAKKSSGACIQREVEIDPTSMKSIGRWTYEKRGDKFSLTPLSPIKK